MIPSTLNPMKERIVLSFIAAAVGILVAGIAFSLYQYSKTVSKAPPKQMSVASPTEAPKPSSLFLGIESPKDEEVVQTRVVKLVGKTSRDAIIVVTTATADQVLTPSKTGEFSTTVNIDTGVNAISIVAIAPNGEEARETRTVTYTTESF